MAATPDVPADPPAGPPAEHPSHNDTAGGGVLEHALLTVRPGRESAFEAAFRRARPVIAAAPGFRGLTLSRCLERPSTYLLLVSWRRLEDHTEGFRGSAGYAAWRELLHHFYDPFPVVEHFDPVDLS